MSEPRLLTLAEAAAYCSLSRRGFLDWVDRGIVPGPIAGTRRWDRRAIDAALDRRSGLQPRPDSAPASSALLDDWLAGQHAGSPQGH